jgi:hypothetical protein
MSNDFDLIVLGEGSGVYAIEDVTLSTHPGWPMKKAMISRLAGFHSQPAAKPGLSGTNTDL